MKGKQKFEYRGETVTIQKTGIIATCKRCNHQWTYFGSRTHSNCPSCETTVYFGSWKKEKEK